MTPNEVVGRVQRLLLSPGTEWDTIDNEGADVAQIYQGYILPLVGIAAIAQFIGWMGELTMVNPLFNWRLYDSVPAS